MTILKNLAKQGFVVQESGITAQPSRAFSRKKCGECMRQVSFSGRRSYVSLYDRMYRYQNNKAYPYSNSFPPRICYHPLKNYDTGGKIETYARALLFLMIIDFYTMQFENHPRHLSKPGSPNKAGAACDASTAVSSQANFHCRSAWSGLIRFS